MTSEQEWHQWWDDQGGGYDVLLFDLDGTLADTFELNFVAYRAALHEFGVTLGREDYQKVHGLPARLSIPAMACRELSEDEVAAVKRAKLAVFQSLLVHASDLVRALPVATLLQYPKYGVRRAVVTSASGASATAIISAFRWSERIDALVSAEDVEAKPSPAPYLKALELLRTSPERAVAFEDSDIGMSAAVAAGLVVIDVRRSVL